MFATATRAQVAVERVDVSAYTIPTDAPESDATLEWESTTIVVVAIHAGGETGLGYTYADASAASFVASKLAPVLTGSDPVKTADESAGTVVGSRLAPVLTGSDPVKIAAAWEAMATEIRNAGRPGLGFMALSAVDIALWDLKARLLGLPLATLVDAVHDRLPIYGSGGFCSYPLERIREQLGGWVSDGIPRVKMKVGREPDRDPGRLDAAREAIGDGAELFVDANGAFGSAKQALAWAERYALEWSVTWLEEPVSSADVDGLRFLREHGPAGLEIAAGEYAYVPRDFVNMVGAVDCLQADVTRCGGITGLLRVGALCDAHGLDLSAHCAPAVSAHAFCGVARARHLEYFHDHVRVERLLFDGVPEPSGGELRPDRSRPGLGLELKRADAAPYAVA